MHTTVFEAFRSHLASQAAALHGSGVAELGSLDINGSIRSLVPGRVGFDIVAGPGVDVVIEPGHIPPAHRHGYGLVVSISSFQFCPDPQLYKRQIVDLLQPGGRLFLTMCADSCRQRHSTSNNSHAFGDSFRMTPAQLTALFADAFADGQVAQTVDAGQRHADLVYTGVKR